MRIDAHQHYWRVSRGDYAWMGPHVAPLCRDFLPFELEPLLREHGFAGSVVVQAAPTLEETRFLLELATRHASILGVVGWLDLDGPSLDRDLRSLSNPKFLGVRPMLQDLPDPAWIVRPRVLEALQRLEHDGVAFDFLVYARHLPFVCQALDRAPRLRSVIDHAAKPDLRSGDLREWRQCVAEVALRPNVYCKLSGLVTEADLERWSASDLAPAVEHALGCFGEDRLVFGSDWPVCTLAASYARVVSALEEVLGARLDGDFARKLFGDNARRLYALA